jgi:hypothetical protein
MRKEFEALKQVLFVGNTYDPNGNDNWGEVDMLLTNLEKKIDEVEKRIDCAMRSAKEINETISKYTEEIDDGLPIKMSVSDHDLIQNCSNDVDIALDMGEDMCVVDNWYNLFQSKEVNEDKETYPIVNCLDCGQPQPLLDENVHVDSMGKHMVCESCEGSFNVGGDVFMTFESSWGTITCDKEGNVIEVIGDEESCGERNYLFDIEKIDLIEYGKFLNSIGQELDHDEDDILSVGFWKKDNTYNEPDHDWRKNMFTPEEDEDEAPTMLCQDEGKYVAVKDIISKLKAIEVDGETMEYILKQVGMQDQMLKQLFAQTTNDEIDYLHDVRNGKG